LITLDQVQEDFSKHAVRVARVSPGIVCPIMSPEEKNSNLHTRVPPTTVLPAGNGLSNIPVAAASFWRK
jgi:hypothetical protein